MFVAKEVGKIGSAGNLLYIDYFTQLIQNFFVKKCSRFESSNERVMQTPTMSFESSSHATASLRVVSGIIITDSSRTSTYKHRNKFITPWQLNTMKSEAKLNDQSFFFLLE